jgi:hypothetical protein
MGGLTDFRSGIPRRQFIQHMVVIVSAAATVGACGSHVGAPADDSRSDGGAKVHGWKLPDDFTVEVKTLHTEVSSSVVRLSAAGDYVCAADGLNGAGIEVYERTSSTFAGRWKAPRSFEMGGQIEGSLSLFNSRECCWYVADPVSGTVAELFDYPNARYAFDMVSVDRWSWLVATDYDVNDKLAIEFAEYPFFIARVALDGSTSLRRECVVMPQRGGAGEPMSGFRMFYGAKGRDLTEVFHPETGEVAASFSTLKPIAFNPSFEPVVEVTDRPTPIAWSPNGYGLCISVDRSWVGIWKLGDNRVYRSEISVLTNRGKRSWNPVVKDACDDGAAGFWFIADDLLVHLVHPDG